MASLVDLKNRVFDNLGSVGDWIGLLPIRLLMAWYVPRSDIRTGQLALDLLVKHFRQ